MIEDIRELEPLKTSGRKSKAVWEADQDLRVIHNVVSEQKLFDILAKEIVAEIDAEILNDLRNAAFTPPDATRQKKRSIDDPWEGT